MNKYAQLYIDKIAGDLPYLLKKTPPIKDEHKDIMTGEPGNRRATPEFREYLKNVAWETGLSEQDPKDKHKLFPHLAPGEKPSVDDWVDAQEALMAAESDLNPGAVLTEKFKDSKGKNVRSIGLGQISTESARGYGLNYINEDLLRDPWHNAYATAHVMKRNLERDGVVEGKWRGYSDEKKKMMPARQRGLSAYFQVAKNGTLISKIKEIIKGRGK